MQRRWRPGGPGAEEIASWRAWVAWAARQRQGGGGERKDKI